MAEALAAVTVPSGVKAGFSDGILSGLRFARQFVGVDDAGLQFDRRDLALEAAFGGGVLRALQRFERVSVLRFARELIFLRGG